VRGEVDTAVGGSKGGGSSKKEAPIKEAPIAIAVRVSPLHVRGSKAAPIPIITKENKIWIANWVILRATNSARGDRPLGTMKELLKEGICIII
jgi:hypothetical protein